MKPVPTDRHPGGPIPVSLRTGIRVLAGLFFLATGIAKLPVIGEVAAVVRAMFDVGELMAWTAAVGVTGSEICVGAMLLSGLRARMAAGFGVLCMSAFSVATGSLIMRGINLDCHCFGVLGLRLPLAGEAALDLILAALMVALRRSLPPDDGTEKRFRVLLLVALLLPAAAAMTSRTGRGVDEGREIARQFGWREGDPHPRLLLLLDLREFQCALCFDDFLALCDSLRSRPPGWEQAFTILRREGSGGVSEQDLRVWAVETGIAGRCSVLEGEAFDGLHSGGNAAILLRPDVTTQLRAELPLGPEGRNHLLALLAER